MRFQPEAGAESVWLLSPTEGAPLRAVTACSDGKVAVWDLEIKHKGKSEAGLVRALNLNTHCSAFALADDVLTFAVRGSVLQTGLTGADSEAEVLHCGPEDVKGLVVTSVRGRRWHLVTLATRTLFLCEGNTLAELPSVGRISLTNDGFLMSVTRDDGACDLVRTAEIWSRTAPVPVTSLSTKPSEGRVQCRPVKTRARCDAELEREEKTISQMSPLLRSGLLSYPALQRPAIWASLLGLPRNKKVQLAHCRRHRTDPEDVVSGLTAWSPDLQLVPHLSSLLSPFLRLYSGHSTTAMELSLVLLTSFTWLTSYPAPSPPMLTSWRLLAQERPELTGHLSCLGASCRSVFWPALQSGWRSVLPDSDWWRLWDHLVTTGPGLVVPALVALLLCLENTVMACTNLTMLNNLFTSQVALDMTSFLRLSYDLLGKYQHQIQSILLPLPDLSQGLPPPLTLERENRAVLTEVNPHHDNLVFIPAKLPARELSPPPVPRLRSNSRQAIIEAAGRGNRQEGDKENRIEVAGPLVPGYPARTEAGLETDLEDITSLLRKAKVLRQVIHSGK